MWRAAQRICSTSILLNDLNFSVSNRMVLAKPIEVFLMHQTWVSNFPTTLNGACRGEGYLRKWEVVFTVKLFGGVFFFFFETPCIVQVYL